VDRTQLKQRIVGAIVLVALGVIFIPIILEREEPGISGSNIPVMPKQLEQLSERELPPPPEQPEKPATTRQLVDEQTPADKADKTPTVASKEPSQSTPEKVTATSDKTSKTPARAWVVQVASFSDRNKALALRDRLRKSKYIAFVESLSTTNSTLYRVRVGPVVKRSEAEVLQKKIIKEFKLKDALVMAHP
jgi:DedD protein